MIHNTPTKLNAAIEAVNKRYFIGQNDDDQIFKMVETDKSTKGFSFWAGYDSYILLTDIQKLSWLADQYGYWNKEVKNFNEILKSKGGNTYMQDLNNQYRETLK